GTQAVLNKHPFLGVFLIFLGFKFLSIKYQFEENGETKYWSGRGRAPKPIAEALAGGRSLDEFIIKKDASSSAGDEQ
ncbi:H-NS histone family protein, partial [Escherichia coli]|nr:H-NS histone family protein [Escherichia coli]